MRRTFSRTQKFWWQFFELQIHFWRNAISKFSALLILVDPDVQRRRGFIIFSHKSFLQLALKKSLHKNLQRRKFAAAKVCARKNYTGSSKKIVVQVEIALLYLGNPAKKKTSNFENLGNNFAKRNRRQKFCCSFNFVGKISSHFF